MPRIRTIKPEFFFDEDLVKLSPYVRLLFIGMWGHADRRGRLEDRPAYLRAHIFPYEEFEADQAISALSPKFIKRYEVGGRKYIQIINFQKHQRITGKEAEIESIIPAPEGIGEGSNCESPVKHLGAQEGKGREEEGKGKDNSNHQKVVAHILSTFRAKKGAPYPFAGEDGRVIKSLLGFYDAAQIMALWDCFLAWDDEWIRKVGHKIPEFRRQITVLLDKSDYKSKLAKYQAAEGGTPISVNLKTTRGLS